MHSLFVLLSMLNSSIPSYISFHYIFFSLIVIAATLFRSLMLLSCSFHLVVLILWQRIRARLYVDLSNLSFKYFLKFILGHCNCIPTNSLCLVWSDDLLPYTYNLRQKCFALVRRCPILIFNAQIFIIFPCLKIFFRALCECGSW